MTTLQYAITVLKAHLEAIGSDPRLAELATDKHRASCERGIALMELHSQFSPIEESDERAAASL